MVFDCEIKNEIGKNGVTWNDHHKMGHAVSCLYDYRDSDYRIYFDDNIDEMVTRINEADLVVAFNNKGFDNKLLNADPTIKVRLRPDIDINCYDMLEVSRRGLGWTGGGRFPSGLKLDEHLGAMFGKWGMKSGDGANAPVLWQQRKLGTLTSYVIRDVKCEKMLFEAAWMSGKFKTFAHPEFSIEKPQVMLERILSARRAAFPQSGAV